ncbi:MAG: hypothetical protein DI585_01730 [Pseudomonas fluorescens]|nr:MAG: hypothetical protein DI585_01730 [Pseudomonas fluorescens]
MATFNNDDKYGTNTEIYGKSRFSHTGMFYGYDTDGSLLLADQFNGGALKVRKYSCNGGLQSCNSFHTIKTPGNSFNMFRSPLLQTLEFAYNLTKNYSPLSKS